MAQHRLVLGVVPAALAAMLLALAALLLLGGCSWSENDPGGGVTSTMVEGGDPTGVEGAQMSVAELVPELAAFGELAVIESAPVSYTFDSDGDMNYLPDGAGLFVSEDAFDEETTLTVTTVGLALEYLNPRLGPAKVYVIEADREIPSLGNRVILDVPFPAEASGVAMLEEGEWVGLDVQKGGSTFIDIPHFSKAVIAFIPTGIEFITEVGGSLRGSQGLLWPSEAEQRATEQRHREWVAAQDQSTRDFYGLDEQGEYVLPTRTQEEMCAELRTVVAEYDDFSLPAEYDSTWNRYWRLARFLFAGRDPAEYTDHPEFWDYTQRTMTSINKQVLASSTPLTPGGVLRIAIEANGGNVPLGLLAAHNYLKQIAYQGRGHSDPDNVDDAGVPEAPRPVPVLTGTPVGHLEPWREGGPTNPSGRLDKVGSLYHIFAAAVAGVWGPQRAADEVNLGDIAVAGEALLRAGFTRTMVRAGFPIDAVLGSADVPDREKGRADQCGARLADAVNALATGGPADVDPGAGEAPTGAAENTPPVAEDMTVSAGAVPLSISLQASDADGDALVYEVVLPPDKGTLAGTGPVMVYTPQSGFVGTDAFIYRVYDGTAYSRVATVQIEMTELRYKGTVRALSKPPLPVYELSGSDVELVVADGTVSVVVEFTLVAVLKWEGETNLCTGTMHRVYKGQGPMADPLRVELALVDSSDALQGPDCGGVVPMVVQSQLLEEGRFSDDGTTFTGNIRNAWQVNATRVEP